MAIRITAIRLSGGTTHQHIVQLWWTSPSSGESRNNSRSEIVAWIEDQALGAYVQDFFGHRSPVAVVTPTYGEKYLRTHADGVWTDNLLALPQR